MELLSNKVQVAAGQSLFLATVKQQGFTAASALSMFASTSTAIVAGFKSKVKTIDYITVQGARVPVLTEDQVITIGNESFVLETKGNKPKAPALIMENGGRTMTLGLLQQGSEKTTVTFKGFGNDRTVKGTELTLEDVELFIGNEFYCKNWSRDMSQPIIRNNADGTQQTPRAANVYEIVLTKAA